MPHHGPKTICCGEGGSVGCLNPNLSDNWGTRRKEEAGATRILTYCAGCANFLGAKTPTSHVLDLLFDPESGLGVAMLRTTQFNPVTRQLLINLAGTAARR